MKIRNMRGFALEIAATGQVVGPNEVAEVADALGESLCEQPDNWTAAPDPPAAKAAAKKAAPAEGDE